ncbi:MAG: Cys-tRNA(Pro) deacylase [Endomicrobium sp.]|jgi:Cys-tRNA(Pro)/Cys-tRNA(Cys) deacylase|nr:Cys-tRNA(Pro) deacylase [Endomicrobium sp.]
MNKTNAARILDVNKIHYELVNYIVDENDLSAVNVSKKLGQNVKQVFKTLVVKGDKNGIFVCVVAGDAEIDLKKAAKVSGNKNAELIAVKDIMKITGYVRGGCSPLGMKKNYPVFIDLSCKHFDFIYISAGIRGMQIKISPQDLTDVLKAGAADLTHMQGG